MTDAFEEPRMISIRSADDTEIACFQRGPGALDEPRGAEGALPFNKLNKPPLLLIHGALMDHNGWNALAPLLRERFSLYAIDRRGRGKSGDAETYAVEREVEDIEAVLRQADGVSDVIGHSSGGILALLAAELGLPIRRLVLYEPPLIIEGRRPRYAPDLVDRLLGLAAADPDATVRTFLREGPMWTDAEIERLAAEPARWAVLLRMARSVAYDAAIVGGYEFDPARLRRIEQPALVLSGGASPSWYREAAETLVRALPNAELRVLPGQTHMGIYQAPDLVAAEVLGFLAG